MLFPDQLPRGDMGEPSARSRWIRRVLLILLVLAAVAYYQASDTSYGRAIPSADRTARSRLRGRDAGPQGRYREPRQGARVSPDAVTRHGDAPFYDTGTLRTIFLQFPQTNWEQELASRYHTAVDLPASLSVDGTTYRDVGVRFRGNSSYRMVPPGLKRSLNVAIDSVHPDQQVGGYRTLNLLNANNDPTFVRTVLYSEIARKYLPAPKVNFVRVVINGESWGVYLNAQQFNKEFLQDFFGTTRGARWKAPGSPRGRSGLEYLGDSVDLYRGLYELKSKEDPKSWSDLVRLCRLLNTTPPESLEAVLAPHLDIDGALRFLAVDVALVNSDGYWTRASDYSLFQDARGRFHVLPYDFNEALGVQGGGRRGMAEGGAAMLDPLVGLEDRSKPLRSRLLAVPALRARYLAYIRDIAENWMDWTKLSPLVMSYQSLIEADVKADGRRLYGIEGFDPASLQRFFEHRRAFLLQAQEDNHD